MNVVCVKQNVYTNLYTRQLLLLLIIHVVGYDNTFMLSVTKTRCCRKGAVDRKSAVDRRQRGGAVDAVMNKVKVTMIKLIQLHDSIVMGHPMR